MKEEREEYLQGGEVMKLKEEKYLQGGEVMKLKEEKNLKEELNEWMDVHKQLPRFF